MGFPTAARPRWEKDQTPYDSGFPSVDLERRSVEENDMTTSSYLEMNSLKSGKTFIAGVRAQRVDEAGTIFKSNIEHTWSTNRAAKAFAHE